MALNSREVGKRISTKFSMKPKDRIPPQIAENHTLIDCLNGRFAKVCFCHSHLVLNYFWRVGGDGYAVCRFPGVRKTMLMHKIITVAASNVEVDHINHDPRDNRCLNLRVCTKAQNQYNRKVRKNNKSGVKGVHWCKDRNKWRASIGGGKFGKTIAIGYFADKNEAIIARKKVEIEMHGEFALRSEFETELAK